MPLLLIIIWEFKGRFSVREGNPPHPATRPQADPVKVEAYTTNNQNSVSVAETKRGESELCGQSEVWKDIVTNEGLCRRYENSLWFFVFFTHYNIGNCDPLAI